MGEETIGLISGTGPQGRGLAMRFAAAGLTVLLGSRKADKAEETTKELNAKINEYFPGLSFPKIQGVENSFAIRNSTLVMLTVPFENAEDTLDSLKTDFQKGTVFVDVTVPLLFGKGDVQLIEQPSGSGSKQLRKLLPETIPFTGAFKTLPAHVLEELSLSMDCDTFVFGDSKEAKERLMGTIKRISSLRPLDVGGLSAAATVEGMTALLIRVNRKLKSREGRFQVVGVSE